MRKDQLPAYISWEQYERNLARLQANRARADTLGVARQGEALLAGLLHCAVCGHRMTVQYHGQTNRPRYVCTRLATAPTRGARPWGETCQQVAGRGLDAFVSRWVLAALEPAALELSLAAAEHLEQERAEVLRLWQQRRERATYEAERAARQYRLVEPENRLVARALERTWEEQLAAQQQLEDAYHRFLATQPRLLTAPERAAIVRLAADIPALWAAATTTNADRKALIRQIVERVVVAAHGTSERVRVTIDWVGGTQTTDEFIRPVARWEQMSSYSVVRTRLAQWVAEGRSTAEMAQRLNAEGFRPPKRRETFTPDEVQGCSAGWGCGASRTSPRHGRRWASTSGGLAPVWWTL